MQRRFLLVLALLLLVAVAGVTTFGVATRTQGQQALEAVLERHEAGGYGTSFADLAADAPPVDRDRQARLRKWMKSHKLSNVGLSAVRDLGWRLDGLDDPPKKLIETHEEHRGLAGGLDAMFTEGELCLTSLGWMPEDPSSASFSDRVGGPLPNLLAVRAAYKWFAIEAGLAEDPTHALDVLDRLHASLAKPGTLIDSMITIACDAMRDNAFVALTLCERMPKERVEAWLREPPRAAQQIADGLRGERLRFGGPMGHALVAGESVSDHVGDGWTTDGASDLWKYQIRPWVYGAEECAVYLDGQLALERHARGEIDRAELDRLLLPCEDLGVPFSLMIPNQAALLTTTLASTDRHGFARLAVALIVESRAGKDLPTSDVDVLTWARERLPGVIPKSAAPTFRYVRLAEDRFRIGMQFDPGDGWRQFEMPASEHPLVLRHDVIEIGLPQ